MDKILHLENQKVVPVKGWEATSKKTGSWGVFCDVFLRDAAVQPVTSDITGLLEETNYVGVRLQTQAQQQLAFPIALLRLVQMYLNERLIQLLERQQRIFWTYFERLRRDLATGIFVLRVPPFQEPLPPDP